MTTDELSILRGMPTKRIRQNYHLCQRQIEMIYEQGCPPRLDEAGGKLMEWQADYLDEMVRRGEQV
jgi:hypothetical protein